MIGDKTQIQDQNSKNNKSEVRRAILRMGSNYLRLFTSVAIGLMLVRLIVANWGDDAWALIAFLGGTLGIAAMLQDIVRQSMIRELASALHSGNTKRFLAMYNSALIVTAAVALITFIVVVVLAIILPIFDIPKDLLVAARWLVIAKGIETVFAIIFGAPMNMYIATERIALSNMWIVCQRLCPIVAASWLIFFVGLDDPVQGLKMYAVISASLFIIVQLVAVTTISCIDSRVVPRLKYSTKSTIRELLHVGGWNAVAVTSLGMHIRIDAILMNVFLGLPGNFIYGLTAQLTSYVRMLAMGVSYGLDAVTTRLSSNEGEDAVRDLCKHITRLNSSIALPAAAGLFVMAGPVLTIWVGDRMEDPQTQLPLTIVLIRIMSIGMAIRALTDGWIKIMYGAGHVAKYAPIILGGGIANPILAIVLYYLLPESNKFIFAVSSYTTVYIFFNLGLLPKLMGKLLGGSTFSMFSPAIGPLIATIVSASGLFLIAKQITNWNLLLFGLVCFGYGLLYVVLVILFESSFLIRRFCPFLCEINTSTSPSMS